MMAETRLTDAPQLDGAEQLTESSSQSLIDLRDLPSPEILRVLAIGSPQVVMSCVMTLYRLGYAEPKEWSRALPTHNPGEVMRILTKRVLC